MWVVSVNLNVTFNDIEMYVEPPYRSSTAGRKHHQTTRLIMKRKPLVLVGRFCSSLHTGTTHTIPQYMVLYNMRVTHFSTVTARIKQ